MLRIVQNNLSEESKRVYESLIPEGHTLYKINQKVDFSFVNVLCKELYSSEMGRPAYSPEQMFRGAVVQYYYGLSDRKTEEELTFNIIGKWFIGLDIDDKSFDHSTICVFRNRLGARKFDEIFDRILDQIVEAGCLTEEERLIGDSTSIIADIAIPNTVELIKQACKKVYKILKKLDWKSLQEIDKDVLFGRINNKAYFKAKKKHLTEVVIQAKKLIEIAETQLKDSSIEESVRVKLKENLGLLLRILMENVREVEVEVYDEDRKSKDRVVSAVDTDARHSHKSTKRRFTGYKAHAQMAENRIITKIDVSRGNVDDSKPVVGMVDNQKHGIKHRKLIGDKLIGSLDNRMALKNRDMQLVSPLREKRERLENYLTNDKFKYDPKANTVTCPAGNVSKHFYHFKNKKIKQFHFWGHCDLCDLKRRCTTSKCRKVNISDFHKEIEEIRKYNKTEGYEDDMLTRKRIEPKFAEMKRFHGLSRARYRGLNKVGIQVKMTGIVVNLKRFMVLLDEKQNILSKICFIFKQVFVNLYKIVSFW